MYILNNKEKVCLITIARRTRDRYLRKNKYTYLEDDIDMLGESILISNENIENDFERKNDMNIEVNEFEKIFCDLYLLKSTKNLSYREKLVLFSYYLENKTDSIIGKELHIKGDTIRKIRERAIEKINKNYWKLKGENTNGI